MLFGQDIGVYESVEEPKLIHHGAKIMSSAREIKVIAKWTDQGWGNTKSKSFWVRYQIRTQVEIGQLSGLK